MRWTSSPRGSPLIDDVVLRVTGPDVVNLGEPWEFHRRMQWRLDLRDSRIRYAEFLRLAGVRPTGAGKRILDPARKAAVLFWLTELEYQCAADPTEYAEAADSILARGTVTRGNSAPKRVDGTVNAF